MISYKIIAIVQCIFVPIMLGLDLLYYTYPTSSVLFVLLLNCLIFEIIIISFMIFNFVKDFKSRHKGANL